MARLENGQRIASFFIFGALNGPIGGPPAFFLTGIGAGLGINRQLRRPDDLSQFDDYPFIKALDVAASVSDPMAELQRLDDVFPGRRSDSSGLRRASASRASHSSMASPSWRLHSVDGLDINLLGLARMALPRPQVALVSIELGLLARFSTREGIFSIQAQLTENSWLLFPESGLPAGSRSSMWFDGPVRAASSCSPSAAIIRASIATAIPRCRASG